MKSIRNNLDELIETLLRSNNLSLSSFKLAHKLISLSASEDLQDDSQNYMPSKKVIQVVEDLLKRSREIERFKKSIFDLSRLIILRGGKSELLESFVAEQFSSNTSIDEKSLLNAYHSVVSKLPMQNHESILQFMKIAYEDDELLCRLIDQLPDKQQQMLRFTIHDIDQQVFLIFYRSNKDPRENAEVKKSYLGKFQLLYELKQREADAISAIPWLNEIATEPKIEQSVVSENIEQATWRKTIEDAIRVYARLVVETIQRKVDEAAK